MDLKEVGCVGVGLVKLPQNRAQWLQHGNELPVLQQAGNFLTS